MFKFLVCTESVKKRVWYPVNKQITKVNVNDRVSITISPIIDIITQCHPLKYLLIIKSLVLLQLILL